MKLSRREFVELVAGSLVALGVSEVFHAEIAQALQTGTKRLPVIWIQANGCGGCTAGLLDSAHPKIKELFDEMIEMLYHPQISSLNHSKHIDYLYQISKKNKGKYYLVVEGAIPTESQGELSVLGERAGNLITFAKLIEDLSKEAAAILTAGTCAAYGGVSAAKPNIAGCKGVDRVAKGAQIINLPGCPTHPDWLLGSLAHILLYNKLPETDDYGRPKMFYSHVIHDNCPKRQYFDNSKFAKNIGEEGCLLELGCKGPRVFGDCYIRQWNNGQNWCVRSGAPCIGCTEPNFPEDTAPFFEPMGNISLFGITSTADTLGKIAGTITALGIGAHLAGSVINGRVGKRNRSKKEVELHD